MPGTHVALSTRTVSQRTEISGTAPELRLTETDQTDPAGRYRLQVTGDVLNIDRAASAGWATSTNLIAIDEAAGVLTVTLSGSAPELRFAETDQTDPVGRWRLRGATTGTVDSLFFENSAAAAWASDNDYLILNDSGVGVSLLPSYTDTSTSNFYGAQLLLVARNAANTARLIVGFAAQIGIDDTSTVNYTSSTPLTGVGGSVQTEAGSTGTITNAAELRAGISSVTGATVTNLYGLYVDHPAGTPTNRYGVFMEDVSAGGTINVGIALGTDADVAIHHKNTSTLANTAVGGILVGTPVTPVAPAANSLFIADITASGDILIAVNNGGNSYMGLMLDASAGDTLLGAISGSSVDVYIAGTKVLDIAANLMTYSAAASTANQVLAVTNTSNAAAASHAYVDISVGGTTSTGDPHTRYTIPSGTSWYVGVDNSNARDQFFIGSGTTVGSSDGASIRLDGSTSYADGGTNPILLNPGNGTIGSSSTFNSVRVGAITGTLSSTTQRTALGSQFEVLVTTLNQSGGAVTVDKFAGIVGVGATAGASVTLTHSSAIRALTGGAAVNVSGLYVEAQTAGTTGSYGIILEDSATAGIWLSSNADSVDAAGGIVFGLSRDTNLYRSAANVLRSDDTLTLGGTLGLTGTRVSNIFTTNQTTTNAETVDSWGATKQNILPYRDALSVIRGVSVMSYEHQYAFDPTGRRKLGVLAESIGESLVTPMDDYVGLGLGPRLDMLGLAALNTRAIQQVDARLTALEADNWLKEQIRARKNDPEFKQLLREALEI